MWVLYDFLDTFDNEAFDVSTAKHEILVTDACSDLVYYSFTLFYWHTKNKFHDCMSDSFKYTSSSNLNASIIIWS